MADIKISELNELETRHKEDLLTIVDTNNNETKKIKVETLAPENFELYAIADTQPTIPVGESYYNTKSNKIFTNVGGIYVDKGEPKKGILYIIFSDKATFAYNGTTLVSVGGGSGETDAPIGTITPFAGTTPPSDYLLCDGTAVSRTTYSDLFAIIGTTYGSGDGSTTFNLPNLKGRVPVGLDGTDTDFDTIGKTGGSKELQEHSHPLNDNTLGSYYSGVGAVLNSGDTSVGRAHENPQLATTGKTGTGDSGNLQPYIVVNYIIKATKTTPIQAEVVNTQSNSTTDTYSCNHINGDVLYYDTTGTADSVQLSNSIDDYRYLEIFYTSSGYQNSLKIDLSLDKTITLNRPFIYGGAYGDRMSKYNIAGSTITYIECLTINSNFQSVMAGNPEIIIKKVIGYK